MQISVADDLQGVKSNKTINNFSGWLFFLAIILLVTYGGKERTTKIDFLCAKGWKKVKGRKGRRAAAEDVGQVWDGGGLDGMDRGEDSGDSGKHNKPTGSTDGNGRG
jgi:hypothetical protein